VGVLTEEELAVVGRVRDAYRALIPIPCTRCDYCQPCPSGVKIPSIFEIYNELAMYGGIERARMFYDWIKPEGRADQCTECGECEEKCPQQIEIIDWLKKAHETVGSSTPS
jgi:predicted aldo/keto reductase-like oxidoreductase